MSSWMAAMIAVVAFDHTAKEMFHEDDKVPGVRLGNQGWRNQGSGGWQRNRRVLRRLRDKGQYRFGFREVTSGAVGMSPKRSQGVPITAEETYRPLRMPASETVRDSEEKEQEWKDPTRPGQLFRPL